MKKKVLAGLLLALVVTGCGEKPIEVVSDVPTDITVAVDDTVEPVEDQEPEEIEEQEPEMEGLAEAVEIVHISDNFSINKDTEYDEHSYALFYYQFYMEYIRQDITVLDVDYENETINAEYGSFTYVEDKIYYTNNDIYLVALLEEGDIDKFSFATREEVKPNIDTVVATMEGNAYSDIEGYTIYDITTLTGEKYSYLLNNLGNVESITDKSDDTIISITEDLQGISYATAEYEETTVDVILDYWNEINRMLP